MRSKLQWPNLLVQMAIGFGALYYAYQQLFIGNELGFLESGANLMSLFIGCMGLLSLLLLLDYKIVTVDSANIEEKRFLGIGTKQFDRNQIREYTEVKTHGEFIVYRTLTLFADEELLQVSSIDIRNYDELKSELIRDLDRRSDYEEKCSRSINRLGLGLLIFILLGLFLLILNNG